ncbi:hypothetical protein ACWV27_20780 [Massilia varians]
MTTTGTSIALPPHGGGQVCTHQPSQADTILLWTVLSVSSDTILFGTNTDQVFELIRLTIYVLATLYLITLPNAVDGVHASRRFYLALVCCCGITALFNFDFTGGYIYQVWIIGLGYLFSTRFSVAGFARVFTQYLFFLCCCSLVGFALAKSASPLLGLFPSGENSAGVEFTNLYFSAVFKETAEIRNGSIFREPGVFMIYIILALVFHLFKAPVKSFKFIAVAIVSLATTYSTAGYLVLVLVFIAYSFKDGFSVFSARVAWLFAMLAAALALFVLDPAIFDTVFSKLDSGSASYGSSIARLASVVTNFEIYISNAFVGAGLTAYGPLFERFSSIHFGLPLEASSQSTNTIMAILATYGTLMGLLILCGLFSLARNLVTGKIVQLFVLLSFLLIFSSQDMRYSVAVFILIFLGLQPRDHVNKKA